MHIVLEFRDRYRKINKSENYALSTNIYGMIEIKENIGENIHLINIRVKSTKKN